MLWHGHDGLERVITIAWNAHQALEGSIQLLNEEEAAWIERCRQVWEARFDELDKVVDELKRKRVMDERKEAERAPMKNPTTVERKSERELVITRTFNAPARIVFEAWTTPELLKRWWAPKSSGATLVSCETDVRVGGRYRFEFAHGASRMAFFGKYIEVIPNSRLVWSNEESDDGAVTALTFEEEGGKTRLVKHERYPSKEALDRSMAGMEGGTPETFEQLDELLIVLVAQKAS
jgi:uncharacterized protein YndB with AHSA1/START domain